MARWDVSPIPGRRSPGYVLDVQADLLSDLNTRVVIPLLPETEARRGAARLNPSFYTNGASYTLMTHLRAMTHLMAAISHGELSRPVVSFKDHHDAIIAAIDMFIAGF